MFTVFLTLPNKVYSGLKGLDMRRVLKLDDSKCRLEFTGEMTRPLLVSESVARMHFTYEQERDIVQVPVELLVPEDVWLEEGATRAMWNRLTTDERRLELYHAVKFGELRDQLTSNTTSGGQRPSEDTHGRILGRSIDQFLTAQGGMVK